MNTISKYKIKWVQQAKRMQRKLKKTAVLSPLPYLSIRNISVCEGSLDLSILVSMIRRFGNDYF
jgi:hypothetical protein